MQSVMVDIKNTKNGDYIDVMNNPSLAIQMMNDLTEIYGIETDFVYQREGIEGLWLQVTKIGEISKCKA